MAFNSPPVLVIGSGLAGLTLALQLAEGGRAVQLVCKGPISEGNTRYAQGGMAVALSPEDSPRAHMEDTLAAGAGLCEAEAVRVLTEDAPARFHELVARGVAWDCEQGHVALTLEGAHSHRRVVHANGDATGNEIERALVAQVKAHPAIAVREHTFVADLLVSDGHCRGARLEQDGRFEDVAAEAVVLAAGGCGRLFRYTTNPEVATGDGVAMAFRAGAAVRDVEFVQFHPTALHLPGKPTFLISEAVRGEGAVLRNARGEAFMADLHPLRDLAPRDVVAQAIARQMAADGRDFVWLDLSHLDPAMVAHRFPTISRVCAENGIRLPQDPIPVAPAAHYFCGGVVTDLDGRTTLPGLYAAGEVAWTGIHGANRLASNSLLECTVFGHRAAKAILENGSSKFQVPSSKLGNDTLELPPVQPSSTEPGTWNLELGTLKNLLWEKVGLMRDQAGLDSALAQLAAWQGPVEAAYRAKPDRALGELRNMIMVSRLVATAASWRKESRGCHFRLDHPEANNAWIKHLTLRQSAATSSPSIPS